jgi:predicted O-linked N-acetylglucosamine transferase (SPINDLY family)
MIAKVPAVPASFDSSPLGTVMAMAVKGVLSIGDLFGAAGVLQESGQVPAAIALYRTWIAHTPSPMVYAACFNLAVVLSTAGDDAAAEALLRQAIALNPDFVEARLNLGSLLERAGRPDDALAMWNAILTDPIQPDIKTNTWLYVQALNNLGRLLEIRKRYTGSRGGARAQPALDPAQANVITHWVHLRQKQCEWPIYKSMPGTMTEEEHVDTGTSALAMLGASDDPAQQLAAAQRFVAKRCNDRPCRR